MPRLIDAEALKERIITPRANGKDLITELIDSMPTVDAVPVIWCRDCKYRITANCERFGIKRYTQSDSFCSWAEPKDG